MQYDQPNQAKPKITLTQEESLVRGTPTRAWLRGDNAYEKLESYIIEVLETNFYAICALPVDEYGIWRNTRELSEGYYETLGESEGIFNYYDPDTYPEVGHHGVYLTALDNIPSPYGTTQTMDPKRAKEYRWFQIATLDFKVNKRPTASNRSTSGKILACQSNLVEVQHLWRYGKPTAEFFYYPSVNRLKTMFSVLHKLGSGSMGEGEIKALPEFQKITAGYGSKFQLGYGEAPWWSQERDATGLWRGYIKANIKTGIFSSEVRKFYLEP
ncbi:MAG: hypothetical protein V7696_09600 [Halioglobus sp.]